MQRESLAPCAGTAPVLVGRRRGVGFWGLLTTQPTQSISPGSVRDPILKKKKWRSTEEDITCCPLPSACKHVQHPTPICIHEHIHMHRSRTHDKKALMTFARHEIKHIVGNKNNRWPLGVAKNTTYIFVPFFLPLFNAP